MCVCVHVYTCCVHIHVHLGIKGPCVHILLYIHDHKSVPILCTCASSCPVYLTDAFPPSAASLSTVDTATRVVSWAAFVYFDFALFISWYQALNIVLYVC